MRAARLPLCERPGPGWVKQRLPETLKQLRDTKMSEEFPPVANSDRILLNLLQEPVS